MDEEKAIVIVDDEAIILLAMKNELVRKLPRNFHVETAIDADHAIELIESLYERNVPVVLILSDWLMPGTKGDEFIALTKAKHPDIHCILVSGQADAKRIAQTRLETLLDDFIEKPWGSKRLFQAVMGCLESPQDRISP
jgi:DNA-binding NtrC family response regulator